jgi:hypothetical protein
MLPRSARWLNDVSSPGAFQGCRLSVSVEDARLVNSLAFFHRWTDAMIMLGNGECRRKAALSNLSGFASRLAQVALPRSFRIGRLRVSAEDARLVNQWGKLFPVSGSGGGGTAGATLSPMRRRL